MAKRIILPITSAEKTSALNWGLYYLKESQWSLLWTLFIVYIWNVPSSSFFSRERFKGSKEHILHSDLSSCIANREVTVKRKARPSGRKWIGYFVYYIYYSYAQGHDESRALLSKNHCAAQSKSWCEFWRAHSQADKTKATADTKHTRFGNTAVLENICSGSWQQLYYFLIGNTDLGWVKAWITGGKGWAKWKTKVARKWEEGGESRSSRRYWTAQDPAR